MPSEPAGQGAAQRLHPSSVLFALIGAVRGFLVPILLLLVFSRGSSTTFWYLWGVVPVLVAFGVKYVSYRYRLDRDELVIREGILTRNERHVPYDRIQNIDLLQNPLHRLFGVAEARIETAGGGEPEAVIRVLSVAAVDEMRRRVFAGRESGQAEAGLAGSAAPAATADTLLRLPAREIVVHGLISNRGMVVVAAAFGLAAQTGLFDFDEGAMGRRLLDRTSLPDPETLSGHAGAVAVWAVLFVVVALVLMRLLSVALALIKLHGFALTRRGDDLRAEYGLLTRVSVTMPIHRIQSLTIEESLTHRLFRRASIRVETAGGGSGGDDEGTQVDRQLLAPVLPRERLAGFVREVLPEIDLEAVEWQPVEWRAWRRRIKPAVVVALLATGGACYGFGWAGLAVLPPALGWAWLAARRGVAAMGWALTSHAVLSRGGWLGRRLTVVRFGKMQVLDRFQSPFDRRHRMAGVGVDTAGGGGLSVRYLDAATANGVLDRLYSEASRRAFRW